MNVIPAPVPPPPVRRPYACNTCGYGASVVKPPPRCPLCGGRHWTLLERR